MGNYEGYVTYADDSIASIQCFEDRHAECPQDPDSLAEDIPEHGPLNGYYCECACHGTDGR